MAKDYNAINFKNKDIDKFATKFGQGDPVKSVVQQARDNANTIANTPYKPKTSEEKAAYYHKKREEAATGVRASMRMLQDASNEASKITGKYGYEKNSKLLDAAGDSVKKYTQKSLENIKNLNRKP